MTLRRALQRGLGRIAAQYRDQGTRGLQIQGVSAGYSSSAGSDYAKLNVASDTFGYNKVLEFLCSKRRPYLLREVYDDMLLDGVQPELSTFLLLITGTMRGDRLQDLMHFFNEMKDMGVAPNHLLFNCVISACGRSNQVNRAFQVASEMQSYGLQPKYGTYVSLLNACGAAGCPEEADGVVKKMIAGGFRVDELCYGALIMAHKNKKPTTVKTFDKIFELLEQSKAEQARAKHSPGESQDTGEDLEDLLANEVLNQGGNTDRMSVKQAAHSAAVIACAELGNEQAMTKAVQMLEQDGYQLDTSVVLQIIKCYISIGSPHKAFAVFQSVQRVGKHTLDLYVVMLEGLLSSPTPENIASASTLLDIMDSRGFFLNTRAGSELLILASGLEGDLDVANRVWDLMRRGKVKPSIRSARVYVTALQMRHMPATDPRLVKAQELSYAGRFLWRADARENS